MSDAKYECLISGAKLMNVTDHAKYADIHRSLKSIGLI